MTPWKLKKKGVVVLFSISLIFSNNANAAIPVIDDQNIFQQIKTYTETVNVVKNTAEQIALQVKELTSLPQQILDRYKTAFDESVASVKQTLEASNFFKDPEKWDDFWNETYPRISGEDYKQTIWSERSVNDTLQEIMSMQNKQDVENYHNLIEELEKSKERLQDLLEQNKTAVGNKQVEQISNQIVAEKAHIESINTSIQAIMNKNQVMKQQSEVMKAINHRTVMEAGAKAERESVKRMKENVIQTSPINSNPFEKYGTNRW